MDLDRPSLYVHQRHNAINDTSTSHSLWCSYPSHLRHPTLAQMSGLGVPPDLHAHAAKRQHVVHPVTALLVANK